MRLVCKACGRIIFSPTRISSDVPVRIERNGDDFEVSTRPGAFSSSCSTSITYIGGRRMVTRNFGSISGNIICCGGGSSGVIINGVPVDSISGPEADKEDDNYKKLWELEVPVFDSVKLNGSGIVNVDSELLSKDDFAVNLVGSADFVVSPTKFKRVTANLVGSGDIDLSDSEVEYATINLTGSGDIKHFVVTVEGSLSLTGSGDIKCRKGPKADVSKRCIGSGDIKVK